MNEIRVIERTKEDYNDLENYLLRNELIDDRRLWFAGFDNYRKATNNAVAGNLLYGNKRLIIVCIMEDKIYYLNNSKHGFRLSLLGMTNEKIKVSSMRNILYPVVDITDKEGKFYSVKVTKNKQSIKEFKKAVK